MPEPERSPTPPVRGEPDLARELTPSERKALDRFVAKTNAEVHGLFQILGSKRRLLMVNLMAGLARGVGFFLGLTLVGGLVIGGLALIVDFTASTLGLQDITFRRIVEIFARKANEARAVWEDVQEEQASTPVVVPAPSTRTRDDGEPAAGEDGAPAPDPSGGGAPAEGGEPPADEDAPPGPDDEREPRDG